MAERILIISQGSTTFMVDAIKKNLSENGFVVELCSPDIKDLKNHVEYATIFLFYLGDFLDDIRESLVFLKDVCIENEKSLNVIGDNSEVEDLKKTIPEGIIDNIFPRPLDIKKMVATLMDVAENVDLIGQKKCILLVDDDATFLRMVRDWLSDSYRVTIVSSGMQAITYIAKNTPDLILLDYEMPITSGPKVLEMIRSESASNSIPVIFLTGKGDKESVTSVLALKPDGYILKSAGKEKLLSQIADFFEGQKARRV